MKLRAVLFDVYGTLLRSAAGETHPDPAMRALIGKAHAASPHPFPEVDIREIHAVLHSKLSATEIEQLAMEHEKTINPVTAMPDASETLRELSSQGFKLGLISNAQFYTLPALESSLGDTLANFGIDPDLCFFSYLERRAKPDVHLFEIARKRLLEQGIQPHEVLYVGNDVRNDIDPAKSCGFLTALFTGDETSLRLRGRPLEESGASLILASLGDLPKQISIHPPH